MIKQATITLTHDDGTITTVKLEGTVSLEPAYRPGLATLVLKSSGSLYMTESKGAKRRGRPPKSAVVGPPPFILVAPRKRGRPPKNLGVRGVETAPATASASARQRKKGNKTLRQPVKAVRRRGRPRRVVKGRQSA